MQKRRLPALLLFLFAAALARATSVQPPEFPDLVDRADAIYRGHVTAVECRRVARSDAVVIRTYVTFAVERTLKGGERAEVVLDFLGGTVDGLTLEVSDVPQFAIGDRDIVFVQGNGRQFCPLVGVMHGRYRIEHDAAANRDVVLRENRLPLADVRDVVQPMTDRTTQSAASQDLSRALGAADFEAQILRQVVTAAATPAQTK